MPERNAKPHTTHGSALLHSDRQSSVLSISTLLPWVLSSSEDPALKFKWEMPYSPACQMSPFTMKPNVVAELGAL